MLTKPIFYDSDVIICFLEIEKQDLLKKLFSKIEMPQQVFIELTKEKTPKNVKNNLKKLISKGFVEIREINFATPEYIKYDCISKGYWSKDLQSVGKGESEAIALAIENNGIVASNNLNDVEEICEEFNVPIITASIILSFAYELQLYSKDEINSIWSKIIDETYQIMPCHTFNKYYKELFKKDCENLLKNYDFKKHYKKEKK